MEILAHAILGFLLGCGGHAFGQVIANALGHSKQTIPWVVLTVYGIIGILCLEIIRA